MFGFGRRRQSSGLLGGLFGGQRNPYYGNYSRYGNSRVTRFIGSPLGQMAVMAGLNWLGNRWANRRNNRQLPPTGPGANF